MTIPFANALSRHHAAAGFTTLLVALATMQALAQSVAGNLPARPSGGIEAVPSALAQSAIEDECLNLGRLFDSGRMTDAQFEVEAKRMLARVGDSGSHDFCKGATLAYLSVALLRQDKLAEAGRAARESIDVLQPSAEPSRMLLHMPFGVLATIALLRNNMAEAERQVARLRPLPATEMSLALEYGLLMDIALLRNRTNEAVQLGKETIAHWERAGFRPSISLEEDLIHLGAALLLCKRPTEAIDFLDRAVKMSEQTPGFSAHAQANAFMGIAQWRAGYGVGAADPYFERALYWFNQVPERRRQGVGRVVYGAYLDYLQKSRRRKEANAVRALLKSFGPDPAQSLVDYSGVAAPPAVTNR